MSILINDRVCTNPANDYVSKSSFSVRHELEQTTCNSRGLGILRLNLRMIYYLHFSITQMAPIVILVPLSHVFHKMMVRNSFCLRQSNYAK